MNKAMALLYGLGIGAVYLLDPEMGRTRRSLLRDKMVHLAHKANDAFGATTRDLNNRAQGLLAATLSLFSLEPASDEKLVARVRSKMGHYVSHPGAIQVTADNGRVILSGPIPASELDTLIRCVSSVRGVAGLENQLEIHERTDHVPGLRDTQTPLNAQAGPRTAQWSPMARLIASVAGSVLAIYGARQRGVIGSALAPIGLGLIARSLGDTDMRRLFDVGRV